MGVAALLLAILVGAAPCFTRITTWPAGRGVTNLRARWASAPACPFRCALGQSAFNKCAGVKAARPHR